MRCEPTDPIDPTTLTPGVRRLVTWLRAHGFKTTDSGDGVANVEAGMEGALSVPHVAMVVKPSQRLVPEAVRLWALLRKVGVHVSPMGVGDNAPTIQATYDPADDVAVILLVGVGDGMLPK